MHFQEDIMILTSAYNRASRDECELMMPMLIDDVVDLLAVATHDVDGWISYWLFDLDCGKEYHDGCITEDDGSIIKLATVYDLWDLLKNS
jgi:hypothetical protein